jgi:hypothetical protein
VWSILATGALYVTSPPHEKSHLAASSCVAVATAAFALFLERVELSHRSAALAVGIGAACAAIAQRGVAFGMVVPLSAAALPSVLGRTAPARLVATALLAVGVVLGSAYAADVFVGATRSQHLFAPWFVGTSPASITKTSFDAATADAIRRTFPWCALLPVAIERSRGGRVTGALALAGAGCLLVQTALIGLAAPLPFVGTVPAVAAILLALTHDRTDAEHARRIPSTLALVCAAGFLVIYARDAVRHPELAAAPFLGVKTALPAALPATKRLWMTAIAPCVAVAVVGALFMRGGRRVAVGALPAAGVLSLAPFLLAAREARPSAEPMRSGLVNEVPKDLRGTPARLEAVVFEGWQLVDERGRVVPPGNKPMGHDFGIRAYYTVTGSSTNHCTFVHIDHRPTRFSAENMDWSTHPMARWKPGEHVADRYEVHLPVYFTSGSYEVLFGVGVLPCTDDRRMAIVSGDHDGAQRIRGGMIRVD